MICIKIIAEMIITVGIYVNFINMKDTFLKYINPEYRFKMAAAVY